MQKRETTGERISDLVKESEKTLSVLAKEIGVSPSLLSEIGNKDTEAVRGSTEKELSEMSDYKKRERNIRSANLIKICNYFGVSADYILCLSDVRTKSETIQGINRMTGLSEKAIEKLCNDFSQHSEISLREIQFIDDLLCCDPTCLYALALAYKEYKEIFTCAEYAEYTEADGLVCLPSGKTFLAVEADREKDIALFRLQKAIIAFAEGETKKCEK